MGWEYQGVSSNPKDFILENSFDGFFLASVESKNHIGVHHSVILNIDGDVIHDPHPNKKWQGLNAIESGKLKYWYMVSRIKG